MYIDEKQSDFVYEPRNALHITYAKRRFYANI